MKRKYTILILLFNLLSYSQDSIKIPTLDYTINYGHIENKKIELQNFKNEIYKSIVVKFKNRPNLIQYLAIELIADENVNFVIISDLIEKLKQNGFFKLFLSGKEKKITSTENDKIGFLIKLNSFYHPFNNKIIDKAIYSIESNDIVENESYLKISDSTTNLNGIDTERLIKNQLEIPSKLIKISSEKIIVDGITYNNKALKNKIIEWYRNNSQTGFVISPNYDCDYQYWLNIISDIYSIVDNERETKSIEEFNLKFKNLSIEKQNSIKNRFPLTIILER